MLRLRRLLLYRLIRLVCCTITLRRHSLYLPSSTHSLIYWRIPCSRCRSLPRTTRRSLHLSRSITLIDRCIPCRGRRRSLGLSLSLSTLPVIIRCLIHTAILTWRRLWTICRLIPAIISRAACRLLSIVEILHPCCITRPVLPRYVLAEILVVARKRLRSCRGACSCGAATSRRYNKCSHVRK